MRMSRPSNWCLYQCGLGNEPTMVVGKMVSTILIGMRNANPRFKGTSSGDQIGDFEIGRILHLKTEIRDLKSDSKDLAQLGQSNLQFLISDLRCRIRPILNVS